jgi:tyrosine-protein phosphatase SIW14
MRGKISRITRLLSVAAFLLMTAARTGSAQPAAPATPDATAAQSVRQPLMPCDTCLSDVTNFSKVSPALWRGAQPTAQGFKALEAAGAKTIVNLRHDHDDLPLLAGTKLKYLWLPSRTWSPSEQNIVLFLRALQDTSNWPIYVHCAQGRDRTGVAVAAYRMAVQGWTAKDAVREMHVFHNNWWWVENAKFVRKLDVEDLKRRVQVTP